MTSLSKSLASPSVHPHLRPFDAGRDLAQVADLVQICFADTLDSDGERYLQHMRQAAGKSGLNRWLGMLDGSGVPMTGYVWEQAGQVVGNLSLIPFFLRGRRQWLIANVAVHPDFRRQGIARQLTLKGIDHARRRQAPAVWLHVREENEPAVRLYRSLGFLERARRTTWHAFAHPPETLLAPGVQLGPRRPFDWPTQRRWMDRIYPAELSWHLALNLANLRPGILAGLYCSLTGAYVQQWSVRRGAELLGVVAWQTGLGYANTLWLAAPPGEDEPALRSLLLHARQQITSRRPITLDYPAHQAVAALAAAGFAAHQTLIWMEVPFS